MHSINICYNVPEAQAENVGKVPKDRAKFMKSTYVTRSDAVRPLYTYFTKAAELTDLMHPEKGTTGNVIFEINEIRNHPYDIQAQIGRASKAPHFEKFQETNLTYSTNPIMGDITFKL